MENKTFLVQTNGFTVEGTYVIVAANKEDAKNIYLSYRKEKIESRKPYSDSNPVWDKYRNAYEIKTILEVPLNETAILHYDDGDR